jgi:tRNA uridine 5-carboxymethylaminomethyl modification enzyme
MPLGRSFGLVSESDYAKFRQKYEEVERLRMFLKDHRWNSAEVSCPGLSGKMDVNAAKGATLEELLRRPGISLKEFEPLLRIHHKWPLLPEVRQSVEIEVRYEGYIQQQVRDAEKMRRLSARRFPPDFDYWGIEGLNRETKEKLSKVRPLDLGMAGRIPGITPAAVSILNIQLEMRQSERRLSTVKTESPENGG